MDVKGVGPLEDRPTGLDLAVWRQTTFYPFLYTSRYGRRKALRRHVKSPVYSCVKYDAVPALSSACVYNNECGEIMYFIVNRSLTDDVALSCTLDGFQAQDVL